MNNNVLLLHGALGSKQELAKLKSHLSKDFKVYDLNFEGHGGTSSSRAFSMDIFAENVRDFLEENQLTEIAIFGFSMGGYVALTLAKKYPNLVRKVFTLGTKFAWTEEFAAKEVKMLVPSKIEEKVPAFAEKLRELHAPEDWKSIMLKTADMLKNLAAGKKLSTNDFQQIKQEVVIARGSLDHMVSQEESKEVAQALPNGHLKSIEGFKHLIGQVDAEKLASYVHDFFRP